MSRNPLIFATAAAYLTVSALAGIQVLAQEEVAEAAPGQEVEEIVVVAPRLVRERRAGLERATVAEMDARVRFGDLDLTTTSDMFVLEERVTEAATRICQQLAEEYPLGFPEVPECARRASADAMAQVREVVRETAGRGR